MYAIRSYYALDTGDVRVPGRLPLVVERIHVMADDARLGKVGGDEEGPVEDA